MIKSVSIFQVISKNMRFLTVISLVTLFLMSFVINTTAQKTNFSGTWAFNESKSTLGQPGQRAFPRFGARQLAVKQEGNILTVDRLSVGRNGEERTNTDKYTLDGKESVNTQARGGSSKSVATWSADGKSLTIVTTRTFERDGQSREMKTTEIWKLSDAKTLSIESTMPSREGGSNKITRVYDKK